MAGIWNEIMIGYLVNNLIEYIYQLQNDVKMEFYSIFLICAYWIPICKVKCYFVKREFKISAETVPEVMN